MSRSTIKTSGLPLSWRSCAWGLLFCLAMLSAVTVSADSAPAGARKSPDWLRNAVVYEIFPRNFSQEGTLNAVTARLDDLKDLGVDVLWFMPIQPIGAKMKKGSIGSPFAVRDFYGVNPDYGTTNDFKRLIDEAHSRGMKVIMGISAGQTSWDSVLMDHSEYYLKDTNGTVLPPDPAWTDVAGLNYKNPEVRHYTSTKNQRVVGKKQVRDFWCRW